MLNSARYELYMRTEIILIETLVITELYIRYFHINFYNPRLHFYNPTFSILHPSIKYKTDATKGVNTRFSHKTHVFFFQLKKKGL